jgi:Bacterial Ig domain
VVLGLWLGATAGFARHALAAGGPFTCSPGFFQVLSGQLNKLNPVTGTYTPIGATYVDTYNAMGYNPLDNFLYAMDTSGHPGDLLKIASDGSVTDLGLPTGVPAGVYIAGDFDNTGHLIIQNTGTTWYSINVSSVTATTLTITGSTGTSNDLVWIGGVMYGLSGAGPTLRSVNLTTLVATTAAVSGIAGGSGAYGAGWSDSPNDLFFSDNSGNGIFSITGFNGGSPVGTKVANGAVTGNNDGAACKLADSPFNSPTANADSYNVAEDSTLNVSVGSGVTTNDAGSLPLTPTLVSGPVHGTLTLNSDGSFTYTPTHGYTGTDTFTYFDTDPFGRTSGNATVTLTVFVPIGVPNAGSATPAIPAPALLLIALGLLLLLRAMRRREA